MNQFTSIYQKASDKTLISLTQRPHKLVEEAREALIVELTNRGMEEELNKMHYELKVAELLSSPDGIDEFMSMMESQGFSQPQIIQELKERGVNMFEIQNRKGDREEVLYTRLADLQDASGKNKLTEDKLKSRYQLTDEELTEIKTRAVRRGKTNLVLGIVLVILSASGFLVSLVAERPRFIILSGLVLGVTLVIKGNKLRRVA